jgi:hypothetical protein
MNILKIYFLTSQYNGDLPRQLAAKPNAALKNVLFYL